MQPRAANRSGKPVRRTSLGIPCTPTSNPTTEASSVPNIGTTSAAQMVVAGAISAQALRGCAHLRKQYLQTSRPGPKNQPQDWTCVSRIPGVISARRQLSPGRRSSLLSDVGRTMQSNPEPRSEPPPVHDYQVCSEGSEHLTLGLISSLRNAIAEAAEPTLA